MTGLRRRLVNGNGRGGVAPQWPMVVLGVVAIAASAAAVLIVAAGADDPTNDRAPICEDLRDAAGQLNDAPNPTTAAEFMASIVRAEDEARALGDGELVEALVVYGDAVRSGDRAARDRGAMRMASVCV